VVMVVSPPGAGKSFFMEDLRARLESAQSAKIVGFDGSSDVLVTHTIVELLDNAVGSLEAALEVLQPGAVAEWRRSHLAAGINAMGSPPTDSIRASAALRALAGARWQPNSAAAASVGAAVSQLERAAGGGASSTSFLGKIEETVQKWMPWSRGSGQRFEVADGMSSGLSS